MSKTVRPSTQSFSATDLEDTLDKTGIVFPLSKPETPQLNVASIVDHREGRVALAHSEARMCFTSEKDECCYTKGRTISYVSYPEKTITPSEAETLIGVTPKKVGGSYYILDHIPQVTEFIHKITSIWDDCEYEPLTEFIKEENLRKKVYPAEKLYRDGYGFRDKVSAPTYQDELKGKKEVYELENLVIADLNKEHNSIFPTVEEFRDFSTKEKKKILFKLSACATLPLDIPMFGTTYEYLNLYVDTLNDLFYDSV